MQSIGVPVGRGSSFAASWTEILALFGRVLPAKRVVELMAQHGRGRPRRGPLTADVVIGLMMIVQTLGTSMTRGLERARLMLTSDAAPAVTEEAFCQARRRIKLSLLRHLLAMLTDLFQKRHRAMMLWKNRFRLLAMDGTAIRLPSLKSLAPWFGCPANQRGASRHPTARLVALTSVLTGFCVAFRIAPFRFSEHTIMRKLLRQIRRNDLLLVDRGFFSYKLLQAVCSSHAFVVMRASKTLLNQIRSRKPTGTNEWIITLRPSAELRKRDKSLPKQFTFRLVQYQFPGFVPCFLITNLPSQEATREEVVSLYAQRWSIETSFREWKHTLSIENIRSHSPVGAIREIYTFVLLHNLVRWMMTDAAKVSGQPPTQLSFTAAMTVVEGMLQRFIDTSPRRRAALYRSMIAQIANHPILQRPGRSYRRPNDGKARNRGHGKITAPHDLRRVA